ncbi:MAG: hypothetical protein R3F20_09255 [Planctomycetota bacterium]
MAVQKDKVDTDGILIWGGLSMIVIYLIVVVLEGFFAGYVAERDAEQFGDPAKTSAGRLETDQMLRLRGGETLPGGKKSVAIEDAMKSVVEQQKSKVR